MEYLDREEQYPQSKHWSGKRYPISGATPWQRWQDDPNWPWNLPGYAQTKQAEFPQWKRAFIWQNREFFSEHHARLNAIQSWPDHTGRTLSWEEHLKSMVPSFQKLEWNCKGAERDLNKLMLH